MANLSSTYLYYMKCTAVLFPFVMTKLNMVWCLEKKIWRTLKMKLPIVSQRVCEKIVVSPYEGFPYEEKNKLLCSISHRKKIHEHFKI